MHCRRSTTTKWVVFLCHTGYCWEGSYSRCLICWNERPLTAQKLIDYSYHPMLCFGRLPTRPYLTIIPYHLSIKPHKWALWDIVWLSTKESDSIFQDIACTATQTALVAPLTEQITLLGPSLPSEGELIDELTLDGVSFNNNGKLVTGVTSDSTPGALNLVTAEFGPPVNGSACQGTVKPDLKWDQQDWPFHSVSLKADAGIAFPSVEYTWYVDSEQRTAGLAYVFEVSALDTISIATGKINRVTGLNWHFVFKLLPAPHWVKVPYKSISRIFASRHRHRQQRQ